MREKGYIGPDATREAAATRIIMQFLPNTGYVCYFAIANVTNPLVAVTANHAPLFFCRLVTQAAFSCRKTNNSVVSAALPGRLKAGQETLDL